MQTKAVNELHASGAEGTGTVTSDTFNTSKATAIEIFVDVTASSGTSETLDVTVETSADGVNFVEIHAFTQITGVDQVAVALSYIDDPLGVLVRVKFAVAGTTPSFTYSSQLVISE